MDVIPTVTDLQQHIATLEGEIARLRLIEAAAREAHAFFAGRRPGFAPSYPRDVLQAVFEPGKPKGPARAQSRRKRS